MNKKALILVCVLLVCLTALTLVACGGQYEMNGFIVDFGKLQSSYQEGDRVDLSVLKITASFTDDTTEVIPLDRVTIVLDGNEITAEEALTKITEKVGKHTLEIKYSDQVKSIEITVTEKHVPVLTKVKLKAADTFNATYNYGDAVDLAGLKVIAVYDETDEVELALSDVELFIGQERVAADLSTITDSVGARSLTAKYQAMTSENNVLITVNDVYTGVVISVPTNTKTTYKVNETVVLEGITAKANFASGPKAISAEDIKIYLGNNLADLSTLTKTKGRKELTIKATYGDTEESISLPITVENFISGISVNVDDVPYLNFVVGAEINAATFAAAKVNVAYADPVDNYEVDITDEGVSFTDVSNMTNTDGEKTVTVTYVGKTATFNFNVVEGDTAIKTLTVESTPYENLTLTAGAEGVSFADLTIKAVYKEDEHLEDEVIGYADFATKGVTLYLNDEVLTNLDNVTKVTEVGLNEVTVKVKYEGKFAPFVVNVNNAVTELTAVPTNKTEYKLEETPTFDDVEVTATLTYGDPKVIDIQDVEFYDGEEKVTEFADYTKALAAKKTVTVKFGGKDASFDISVIDYKIGIWTTAETYTTDVVKTDDAKFDFTGKVFWLYKSGAHSEAITEGLTITNDGITVPTDNEGNEVTITAGGKEKKVHLVVKEVLESIAVTDVPLLYRGAKVNFTKLTVTGTYRYKGAELITIAQADGESIVYSVVKFAWKATAEGEYADILQTELNTIASSVGTHYVKLTYTFNGKDVSDEFEVTVVEASRWISGYESPTALTTNNSTREYASNNQGDVTTKAFESALYIDDKAVYYVGDDNAYKFLPNLYQVNIETEESTTLESFKTDSKVYYGEELLTAVDDKAAGTKTYKKDDTIYVVEKYNTNEFDFTGDAVGKTFTLSVLPDATAFDNVDDYTAKPVVQTVTIVDGFNVDDPKELCVLEQSSRHYWDEIKAEVGLTGISPKAIILHDNMMITKDSLPTSMWYELPNNFNILYTYTDKAGVAHTVRPEDVPKEYGGPCDRTFLYEGEYGIFEYNMSPGSNFTIYGNYYDIDMTRMPRVSAFEADMDIEVPAGFSGTYYGQYQSKISFLVVYGDKNSNTDTFTFSDFAVKGNANMQQVSVSGQSSIKQGTDNLVYAGGLIFVKVWDSVGYINNINAHACFIPYFSYGGTEMTYTNCKAYDSFQCALFVNKNSVNHLNNCHMKGANGPLMIMIQNKTKIDGVDVVQIPVVYADDDCVLESLVAINSLWFVQNGVTAQVALLSSLDPLLGESFGKTMYEEPGKFNVIAVTMPEGSGDINTQAYFSYKGGAIDRLNGDPVFETAKAYAGYGFIAQFISKDGKFALPYTTAANPFDPNAEWELKSITMYGPQAPTEDVVESFSDKDSNFITIIAGEMGIYAGLYTKAE